MPAGGADSAPSPLAETVMGRLTAVYERARDPERAVPMVAYMRGQFAFLGLPAPGQRTLTGEVLTGIAVPTEADLRHIALACWRLDEREYQHFAVRLLRRHAKLCGAAFLGTVATLITTKPWWDTVDELATHVVGSLVARHPALGPTMDAWSVDENMWLARVAILHQIRYRGTTDRARLFGYCERQAGHPDFFIRKAIGWALREYAKTDPDAVRAFVAAHRSELSGLSVREACKHL